MASGSSGGGVGIDLGGHVAIVTGGSRGIGRACALLIGRAGAAVAVHYRARREEADETVAALRAAGGRACAVAADLSDPAGADAIVARCTEELGTPTILVNNAGIWEGSAVDTMTAGDWDRTFAVNVRPVFLLTRAVVPAMKAAGAGRIVNIASTAGQRGEAFHSDYAASKGAVIAFTRSIATELATHGIRVNCVAPGWVDTEMCTEAFAGGGREAIERGIPMGRVGRPEEIAGAVLFAASDLCGFMTGSVISVNGGAVMA